MPEQNIILNDPNFFVYFKLSYFINNYQNILTLFEIFGSVPRCLSLFFFFLNVFFLQSQQNNKKKTEK